MMMLRLESTSEGSRKVSKRPLKNPDSGVAGEQRMAGGLGRRVALVALALFVGVCSPVRGDDECALLSGASPAEMSECLLEQTTRRPSDTGTP